MVFNILVIIGYLILQGFIINIDFDLYRFYLSLKDMQTSTVLVSKNPLIAVVINNINFLT